MKPDIERSSKKMTQHQLLKLMGAEASAAGRQRQARRLAPALSTALGVHPNGIDLVCWIADAHCKSNLEAVAVWIAHELEDPDFQHEALHTPEIDLLAQRLNRRLMKMEASRAC